MQFKPKQVKRNGFQTFWETDGYKPNKKLIILTSENYFIKNKFEKPKYQFYQNSGIPFQTFQTIQERATLVIKAPFGQNTSTTKRFFTRRYKTPLTSTRSKPI